MDPLAKIVLPYNATGTATAITAASTASCESPALSADPSGQGDRI